MLTTTPTVRGLLPDEHGALVVQPVARESVAIQTSTAVGSSSHEYRVPIVLEDPTAGFVAEGAEIAISDPTLAELTVVPAKVAGLVVISRELAEDSDPLAATVVQEGLARDIAKRIDEAWFGALASPAPSGLAALTGVQAVTGAATNLDRYAEAISLAETVGATITSFVTSPATALAVSKLKAGTGSNLPLLGQDASVAGQRTILGVPLLTSPSIPVGTIWAYDASRVWTVIRQDVTLDVDASPYFTSDRVAVRATMRVGFAFPHAASVVKITAT